MLIYILIAVLFISYVLLKYFQFKSLKYFKKKYNDIKPNFLFHGAYYQNKYYADPKGIKYKNTGAFIFVLGIFIAVILAIILKSLGVN